MWVSMTGEFCVNTSCSFNIKKSTFTPLLQSKNKLKKKTQTQALCYFTLRAFQELFLHRVVHLLKGMCIPQAVKKNEFTSCLWLFFINQFLVKYYSKRSDTFDNIPLFLDICAVVIYLNQTVTLHLPTFFPFPPAIQVHLHIVHSQEAKMILNVSLH